jgi:DNA-binding NarL/FixJ family response regulator
MTTEIVCHEEIFVMPKIVTILIADDHALVRRGLKMLLEQEAHFRVIAQAETGEEAIQKAQETHPDVAILDVRMPGLSGISACRQIVDSVEGCRIVMLTAYAEYDLLCAAIQAGATGYILKRVGGNELVHAIENVSRGEGFLDSAMTASVFHEMRRVIEARHADEFASLTPQEMSVLFFLSKGMTNQQIAGKLYLGTGTIRNYVSSVLKKLAVANRAAAAAFAVKHSIEGLLST